MLAPTATLMQEFLKENFERVLLRDRMFEPVFLLR
jgi:hypothetical protein